MAFLTQTKGATWVCCVKHTWHFTPTPTPTPKVYDTYYIYLLNLIPITEPLWSILHHIAPNQSQNMVALWLYKYGVVPSLSMEIYHFCTGTHTKYVKTKKIYFFYHFTCTILHFYTFHYSGEKCQVCSHNILRSHLGCEMPDVFHTTYSGRTLDVGEKCQVCFTQHTQVTGKGVNHIMKSRARRIWMSVIYYYLRTDAL